MKKSNRLVPNAGITAAIKNYIQTNPLPAPLPPLAAHPFANEDLPFPHTTENPDFEAVFYSDGFSNFLREKLTGRLSHALKRIKDKGYYAEKVSRLLSIGKKTGAMPEINSKLLGHAIGLVGGNINLDSISISEDIWFASIDTAMATHHYEVYSDLEKSYGPYIDAEISTIFTYVLFLSCIQDQSLEIDDLVETLMEQEDLVDAAKKQAKVQTKNAAPTTAPDTKALEAAQQRIKELEHTLTAEKRAHQKAVMKLEHQLADAQKDAQKQILSLKEQNTRLMEFILHQDAPEASNETEDTPPAPQTPDKTEYAFRLPESRVLFLGGHRNLTKKVEAKHPDWQFMNTDNYRSRPAGSTIDVVFFWTAHSSHALQ